MDRYARHAILPWYGDEGNRRLQASSALIVGFLRKDVAIGMLGPLGLTTKQLVIASTILAVYFPCMATFVVLVRELGAKDMAKIAGIMILTALIVGTILNFVF